MKLNDIAYFVDDKISSDEISLNEYITTDCLLQNKKGRSVATNLPPQTCSLTKFKKGDVLIGNIRPYLKKIWLADIDGGCSLDVLALRAKNKDESAYLYSVLMQDGFFDFVMKAPKGSKMPRGDKNHILTFPCFSVNHKIEIGKFIKSLDDKIALNRRMNAKLEQMAKRLYDHWFVQFDFPNADGKPYKSSGGKMEYNEVLKREIPDGWEDCKFGDYVERITNGLNPRKNFVLGTGNNYYVTIRSLLDGEIDWNNCDKCDDEALKKINSRSQLQVGDFIFSAIGTIGRTYRIYETPSNWNISETSFTIRPKKTIPTDFFYALLKSYELQLQADRKAMGSTLRCLVMDTLCEIPCIKIDFSVTQKFSNIVRPLFLSIYKNNKEIRKLTALRDRLLPLLMNGQVEVR